MWQQQVDKTKCQTEPVEVFFKLKTAQCDKTKMTNKKGFWFSEAFFIAFLPITKFTFISIQMPL